MTPCSVVLAARSTPRTGGYDGSLKVPKGGKKVLRGSTFVIAAVIAELPFLRRPAAARL